MRRDPAVDDTHTTVFVTDRTPVGVGRLETEHGDYVTLDIDGRHLRIAGTPHVLRRLVSLGERALAEASERIA